jgi:hypothetical protein
LAPVLLLVGLLGGVSAPAQPAAINLLDELNSVALDPIQSYKVTDLYIRRDAVRIHLQHGRLVFLQPVGGRITGAVFEGAGETLVLPPDRTERAQLLRFSGSPILTESFGSAYLRFTDSTFVELLRQIRDGHGRPTHNPELLERWGPLLPGLNRAHSIRVLLDYLQSPPTTYFYAGINGEHLMANTWAPLTSSSTIAARRRRWWGNCAGTTSSGSTTCGPRSNGKTRHHPARWDV